MIANEAQWIHLATSAVEIVGTAIIVVGAFGALAAFLIGLARNKTGRALLVADFRSGLRRSILLGLEFLVAADSVKPSRSSRRSEASSSSPGSSSSGRV